MKLKLSIFLLITILLIASGFIIWNSFGPEIVDRFVPSPTPTPDPYADWKTYTNEEYGFSVKYPEDWFERDETKTDSYFTKSFSYKKISDTTLTFDLVSFTIINNLKDSTLYNQWNTTTEYFNYYISIPEGSKATIKVNPNYAGTIVEKIKNMTINGYESYKILTSPDSDFIGEPYLNTSLAFFKNNKIYRISASNYDSRSDLPEIAEQIIKSIKFND